MSENNTTIVVQEPIPAPELPPINDPIFMQDADEEDPFDDEGFDDDYLDDDDEAPIYNIPE